MGNDWFHEYFINELKAIGRKPTSNMQHEVVDSLPSSGNEQTIYFVKNDSSSSNNHYDEYVWISSSSTFEKIGSTQIDGSATQPDWNQNDATQPDYVKNRPFYTGDPVETVLVEESTASFAVDDVMGFYMSAIPSTFVPIDGNIYKVSWDGIIYETAYVDFNNKPAIGNASIVFGGPDTGEPFFMISSSSSGSLMIYTGDTSSSHTLYISRISTPVIKIDQKYLAIQFKPKGSSFLTFSSPNEFTLITKNKGKNWNGTLEYFSSDEVWTIWDGSSKLSAVANGGEYGLYLRGIGNSRITGGSEQEGWALSGTDIKCIGNIENLLDYATVKSGLDHPVMADSCYSYMFYDCTGLTKAPALPATTLTTSCYSYMFYNCTGLTKAPALPATTLATFCYSNMFSRCTSLTQIPALPAMSLMDFCYSNMFNGCISLKLSTIQTDEYTQKYRIPYSGNGTMETHSLNSMFSSIGGAGIGEPEINTTYYLGSDNIVICDTELATLNGYVSSMIDSALSAIGVAEEGAY